MLDNVKVNCNSSICIFENNFRLYFDPYKIDENSCDADFVFITHDHFDHLDKDSILKIINDKTNIICPAPIVEKVADIVGNYDKIYVLKPDKTIVYNDDKDKEVFELHTVPAYNVGKKFHKKEYGYLGYVLTINDTIYYIAGDTDITDENKKVKCDVAFVPIGGTYTMNYKEAAELVNHIKPKKVVPIHYGSVVGSKEDEENFIKLVDKDIEVCIKLYNTL